MAEAEEAEADEEAEAGKVAEVDSVEGKEIFEGIMAVYSLMGEEQIGWSLNHSKMK